MPPAVVPVVEGPAPAPAPIPPRPTSRKSSNLVALSAAVVMGLFVLLIGKSEDAALGSWSASLASVTTTYYTPSSLSSHQQQHQHPQPNQPPKSQAAPPTVSFTLSSKCLKDEWTPWQEWRDCLFPPAKAAATASFQTYLQDQAEVEFMPWTEHKELGAAVMVECDPTARPLQRAISNVMENLPVAWPVYFAGSPASTKAVEKLYPTEVAVQKVVLLDLGVDAMTLPEVRKMLTSDKSFYEKLTGEHWLFFDVDSVICARQRHWLRHFMEQDFGWWGAPWRYGWPWLPRFGGNDQLSLRRKSFVYEVLDYPDKENLDPNDEMWFSRQALGMINKGLTRRPAPLYVAPRFCVKTLQHSAPFAVHAPWQLPPNYEMKAVVERCPEMLSTFPPQICAEWPALYCAADLDRAAVTARGWNCTWDVCTEDHSALPWAKTLSYVVIE